MSDNENENGIIARCRTCGNIVAIIVDDPDLQAEKTDFVAGCVRDGLALGVMPIEEFRSMSEKFGHADGCTACTKKYRKAAK